MRKIVHVDMDAFYASVEQRDDTRLRQRPVVVAWRGARSVVCAASYEARRFGIHSAMPALRAERLCPHAIFVPPDFARYKAVSRQIHTIFARHTDLIEPLSLDEAYLDVTAADAPSATAVAGAIRAAIRAETGLTASAGIAPNKFLAKIASDWRKPDGQFVISPRRVDAFLTPLPVGKIPGVGKVMRGKLHAMNIATVGDLRRIPQAQLKQRFGRWGTRLYELAQGIDKRPVQPQRDRLQVSTEDTFANDLLLAELETPIRQLATQTWASLQHKSMATARTVVLKLKTSDFRIQTRSTTPAMPPASAAELADIACALRQRINNPPHTRYRLAGVGLSGFISQAEYSEQRRLF